MFFDTAYAAGEAAAQPTMLESMVPIVLIFVAMYFLMIRPQVKKSKEHSQLLSAIKPGDEIVTSGGIIGRIKSVSDGFVTIDCGSTTLKILKENVSSLSVKSSISSQQKKK